MSNQTSAFVGSIPEKYDSYLGPILFETYAADLVERIPPSSASVLEIACGTGIVTRRLRDALDRGARFVASDLNQAMIDHARTKFRSDEAIEWKQADATRLPFADAEFDLVVCQFGLMFFPDKLAALREVHRALRADGRFLCSVWDTIEVNEIALVADRVVKSFFPENPPRFYETPFSCHGRKDVEGLLRNAGFRDVYVDVVSKIGASLSPEDAATGLVEGNPIIGQIMERNPDDLPRIREAIAVELASRYGAGPLECPTRALVWSATR